MYMYFVRTSSVWPSFGLKILSIVLRYRIKDSTAASYSSSVFSPAKRILLETRDR